MQDTGKVIDGIEPMVIARSAEASLLLDFRTQNTERLHDSMLQPILSRFGMEDGL
jgi:hypothetical protein